MTTENSTLMEMAKESLRDKWGLAIGTSVVYILIIGAVQMIPEAGPLITLLITGPMILGLNSFFLSLSRGQDAKLEQIFSGFNNFGKALGTYLLMLLIVFLWALLLIIPGIIAAISYSMAFYILADDNTIGVSEALEKSKKMMDGYKLKYFYLGLRFMGWALLCILTLGIGFFWLIPYMNVTMAKFYDDVKANQTTVES